MANDTIHASALDVVNEALVVLGQDVLLTAETFGKTSNSPHGRKAAYLYEASRTKVLRDHAWSFARREMWADSCPCYAEWEDFPYRIPLPPKCIRVLTCLRGGGDRCTYILHGREIRSREGIAVVQYIADIEDIDRWTPDARRALVLRLAADLAKPITGRINERQLQEQAYNEAMGVAKRNDANESNVPYDAWGENYYVSRMRRGGMKYCDEWRRRDV